MKKKAAIFVSTILLLTLGSVTALNTINPNWRENTIFATARDKQLAWLKEHEEEIVKWMRSVYPKVESVQFNWDSLTVGPVSNGVSINGYNLSIKGEFNNNSDTILIVDFKLEQQDSIPNMSNIRMNHPPRIKRDGGIYIYE